MARRFLYVIAALIILVLGVMLALRIWAGALSSVAFVPSAEFTQQAAFTEMTYSDPDMWFARPGLGNGDVTRYLPEGIGAGKAGAEEAGPEEARVEEPSLGAAVFFVHPTSYFEKQHWNAPLDDPGSRDLAGKFLRGMASPFNHSADLWAPRYRQATFGTFISDSPSAQRALDTAYDDVLQAFEHFLNTIDDARPIVLAGHSQGALHMRRLIAERVSDDALRSRIAAAYLIGWPISLERDVPHLGLPACTGPDQPGCVIGWQSFAEPADTKDVVKGHGLRPWLDGSRRDGRPYLCSNPLAGMANGAQQPASANAGSLVRNEDHPEGRLIAGQIPARCSDEGFLLIGDPPELGSQVLPGNNYHVYDIPMFWANLRQDVSQRVVAWQASR